MGLLRNQKLHLIGATVVPIALALIIVAITQAMT